MSRNPAEPHWYHYVTANFVHGDLMHLVGNMFFLLLFGDNVEDAFGPLPFLALYFLGGLVGDVWFVSANASLAIPSVGASGCIAAIAGAYGLLFFTSTIGVRVIFIVLRNTLGLYQAVPYERALWWSLGLVALTALWIWLWQAMQRGVRGSRRAQDAAAPG